MNPSQKSAQNSLGFSLIEILLVFALSSIFIAFAYPIYTQHLLKTKRMDAKFALLDLAQRMEHYYALHHSYEKATIGIGKATDVKTDALSPQRCYFLSIEAQTKTTYTLLARVRSGQAADEACALFRLNQAGEKGSEPALSPSTTACW